MASLWFFDVITREAIWEEWYQDILYILFCLNLRLKKNRLNPE
jgi:hypothetical protein